MDIRKDFISKFSKIRERVQPIKYIVIGYTCGNSKEYSLAMLKRELQQETIIDFLVDGSEIIQLNDSDNYYPWAVGIPVESNFYITNGNVVFILVVSDRHKNIQDSCKLNLAELVEYLSKKYNICENNILDYKELKERYFYYKHKYNVLV